MPLMTMEGGGFELHQCRCDQCGLTGDVSTTTEDAVVSFQEVRPGVFLCLACVRNNLVDLSAESAYADQRIAHALGIVLDAAPDVDIGPGTVARTLVEAFVVEAFGRQVTGFTPQALEGFVPQAPQANANGDAFELPAHMRLESGGMVYMASEPEFVGRMPVRTELPARPPEPEAPPEPRGLPSWCLPGQLLRMKSGGTPVRVKVVGSDEVRLQQGVKQTLVYPRRDPKLKNFEDLFEPLAAKTRWERLLEED